MRKSGQFYTGQINIQGLWVHKSFFPSDWTPQEVDETGETVYENSKLIAKYANRYAIYQGVLQNRINIRFIIDEVEDEVKVFYPQFDLVIEDHKSHRGENTSWITWLKNKITGSKVPQANPLTEEMQAKLKQQMYDNFRKIVLNNEMDRAIELTFAIKYNDGEEFIDKHYIGPNEGGQIPYFVAGILSVTHGKSMASVDISDRKKEYIFTVHSDGSVTQYTRPNPEMN